MDELLIRLAAFPSGPSPYAAQLRDETRILPALCGLPRVIRAYPAEVSHA